MAPTQPFVDPETGHVSPERLLDEVKPLAELIGVFGLLAFVPLILSFIPFVGVAFNFVAQFILAVGTAVVLLYVLVRAFQLTRTLEEGTSTGADKPSSDAESSTASIVSETETDVDTETPTEAAAAETDPSTD